SVPDTGEVRLPVRQSWGRCGEIGTAYRRTACLVFSFYGLPWHVSQVLLILIAESFKKFRIRQQTVLDKSGNWLRIYFRIVDGDPHIKVTEIAPPKCLREVQSFASRMPHNVQQYFVVESDGFHDESISHPFTYGISQPTGLRFRRKCAAITENLSKYCI